MSIQIGPWPPIAMRHSTVHNLEPGLSDQPRRHAANVAHIWGHTVGGEQVGSPAVANPAPKNGLGRYGHDHSGGAFGKPLYRTIACWTWDQFDVYEPAGSAALIEGRGDAWARLVGWWAQSQPNSATGIQSKHDFALWIPPCPPGSQGAYTNPLVRFVFNVEVATNVASGDDFDLEAINYHPAVFDPQDIPPLSIDLGDLSSTGVKMVTSTTSQHFPVVPGAFNPIRLRLNYTFNGAGSSRSFGVEPMEFEIGVSSRHL